MLAEPLLRNPTMDVPCCARAVTGHAIRVPPKRKMNSRRLIAALDGQERVSYQFAQVVRKGSMSALGQKRTWFTYSITSSAAFSRPNGTVRPSAYAVFRLMTKSNLVGCKTGRSAGFSPLRTRPVYHRALYAGAKSRCWLVAQRGIFRRIGDASRTCRA